VAGQPPVGSEPPDVWVGHVVLATHDVRRAFDFYRSLGLRVFYEPSEGDGLAQLELRGGTQLALVLDPDAKTEGRGAPFDLMVHDVAALHDALAVRGVEVTPVEGGGNDHAHFTFRDPDGHVVTVNDALGHGRYARLD
jgi:catechol 2,3-dioxygenase-like lactoylglutathione lyase family enzyme